MIAPKLMSTAIAVLILLTGSIFLPDDTQARGRQQGGGSQQGAGLSTLIAPLPKEPLSAVEQQGLLTMREEEKLARDVYRILYSQWGQEVFNSIARSEQRHMDAVKALLDRYELEDPAMGNAQGIFHDPELQKLYLALVKKGKKSRIDAYIVGATIEDLDIRDLYELLPQSDNQDIRIVYQNLAKGSRNHLRAFSFQLSSSGTAYTAQFLSQQQIDTIVSSPVERGPVDQNGASMKRGKNFSRGRGGCGPGKVL